MSSKEAKQFIQKKIDEVNRENKIDEDIKDVKKLEFEVKQGPKS